MLVFFLYFLISLLIIFFVLSILMVLSTLEVEIVNLRINNDKNFKNNKNLKVKLCLKFLNIKWFKITLNKKSINKLIFKVDIKRIIEKKDNISENLKMLLKTNRIRKQIKNKLKINLSKLDLKIDFGFDDYIITSYIITLLSMIISITLSKFNKVKNCYYNVSPIYKDKLKFNLNVDCILNVKIGNIIYIIYLLLKRRSDKNDRRSSDRKLNEYSYE